MHGWLVIDKPEDITSARVVAIVRKILGIRKIGHAGTLDPLASGILPLAIGEATKTIAFAMDAKKEYEFTVSFGEARDTDDREGQVIAASDVRPAKAAIEQKLTEFLGQHWQIPPKYSALKVNGERAYNLAREGLDFQLKSRLVTIDKIKLIETDNSDGCTLAKIRLLCGKGTYVRSVARELAEKLGTHGYVSYLRRIRVGSFGIAQAISLSDLENLVHHHSLQNIIIPVEVVLDDIAALTVSYDDMKALRYGQSIKNYIDSNNIEGQLFKAIFANKLVALVSNKKSGWLQPVRVFNY